MKPIKPMTIAVALAALASPAAADDRYYAYEAEGAAARHRTGDLTLAVARSLFGGTRATTVFRRRGADLPLTRDERTFPAAALRAVLRADAGAVSVYAVDAAAGQGFAQGACDGSARAWIAMPTPQPYRNLRLHVLKQDPATRAPVLCETLEYRWRAEWDVPNRTRLPREDPQAAREPF